jgi:hypothetical protein
VHAKSLEEAKKNVVENERKRLELQIARRNAMEFATPLFDMETLQADNLNKLAKEKGLTVQTTAPFDLQDGPKNLDVGQDFAQKAFGRTTNDPFAGPIVAPDGVYVIALDKRVPSEIPPLSQIREQVVQDYKFNQALNLARRAGMAFQQTLTNALAKGSTPAAVCAEAKVKLVDLPPVSLSTRGLPELEDLLPLNQFKQIVFSTAVSNASPFQMTSQGGVVVYVKSKLPLDEAKMNASLAAFANAVRQRRQNEVFNDWFRREAEKGLRDTPLARPQPPPVMSPAAKAKKS